MSVVYLGGPMHLKVHDAEETLYVDADYTGPLDPQPHDLRYTLFITPDGTAVYMQSGMCHREMVAMYGRNRKRVEAITKTWSHLPPPEEKTSADEDPGQEHDDGQGASPDDD